MTREIRIEENGLRVKFLICENGVVELQDFSSSQVPEKARSVERKKSDPENYHPVMEVQISGKTTRGMHGYKHNLSSASLDFRYTGHYFEEREKGRELIISMATDYGLKGTYHMRFFEGIPVVQTWSCLENQGTEDLGLEYVSSFIYQGISGNGEKPYYEKTEIYVPRNSWSCEAQWEKKDIRTVNLSGMPVDGFNTPGFGINRYCYSGRGSWSSCEYLPMGFARDTETEETYCFQIEHSGQWHVEYGSDLEGKLYLALSGPTDVGRILRTINYPGASTQALCSAPTSPLTALAFRSCSRQRESGVCEFVCLCFYI